MNNSKAKPVNAGFIRQNTAPGYLEPGISPTWPHKAALEIFEQVCYFLGMLNISAEDHV